MSATFNPFTGQLDFTGTASSVAAFTSGTATGLTSLGLRSSAAAFDLTLASAEALTAGRTLTFNVGDANRTLTIPATGTVALRDVANTFTKAQTITMGSTVVSAPWMSVTQTWNDGAVTFRGHDIAITETAAAVGSSILRILGGTAGTDERMGLYRLSGTQHQLRINGGLFGGADTAAISCSGAINCDSDIRSYASIATGTSFASIYNGTLGMFLDGGTSQLTLRSPSQTYNLGADSATPAAQTLGGQRGLGTNITGGALNIGTRGTGTGVGGRINLQTHAAGSSSSTLQTLVDVLSIISPGVVRITNIPTSASGLSTGDIYSNAGILTIV